MIEIIVKNHLDNMLDVPVYMEKPSGADTYVTIEKTGSGREDYIEHATFAIQSWADSLYNASLLNEEVKKAMDKLVELPQISKCELNSDYNYTDTQTKSYRYQAVYDITF